MDEMPNITPFAQLIADPTRALMISALASGKAYTAGELAKFANVTPQTASSHLAKLETAGLIVKRVQGRHRYFQIEREDFIELLEKIGAFSLSAPIRTGPRSDALCDARICYNHLAGRRGVALFEALLKMGAITWRDGRLELGDNHQVFARFGIDNPASSCRECLDWSERRSHLGGALGRQIMDAMLAQNWAIRSEGRVIRLTPKGKAQMREMGLQI